MRVCLCLSLYLSACLCLCVSLSVVVCVWLCDFVPVFVSVSVCLSVSICVYWTPPVELKWCPCQPTNQNAGIPLWLRQLEKTRLSVIEGSGPGHPGKGASGKMFRKKRERKSRNWEKRLNKVVGNFWHELERRNICVVGGHPKTSLAQGIQDPLHATATASLPTNKSLTQQLFYWLWLAISSKQNAAVSNQFNTR